MSEHTAEIDALVESLVEAFYDRYPGIGDREDIGESDLRETLRDGLARGVENRKVYDD